MRLDGTHLRVLGMGWMLGHPAGIAVGTEPVTGRDRVYVADTGNDRVLVLSAGGDLISEWPGFDRPRGVEVDPDSDRVFVANSGAHEVKVLSPEGESLETWTGPAGGFDPLDLAIRPDLGQSDAKRIAVTDPSHARVVIFDQAGNRVSSRQAPRPAGIDRAGGRAWVASAAGVLAYDDDAWQLTAQIQRWGLEIDAQSGEVSGRVGAQIPPRFGARVYLRFRFRNQDPDQGLPGTGSAAFDGARIDDLAVRCATAAYRKAYGRREGTSFAAPLVSGVAALYLSRYPRASPTDVIRALRRGADDSRPIEGVRSQGELDAAATLAVSPGTLRGRPR
jgi:hypothetical protein